MDLITLFFKKAIDTLFLSHRLRTSFGILIGVLINAFIKLFAPFFDKYSTIIDISVLSIGNCIVFGILLMQAKTIFFLMKRKSPQDEKTEKGLLIIEDAKKMGLPKWQIDQMYYMLFMKTLDELGLNDKAKKELKELENRSETSPTTTAS